MESRGWLSAVIDISHPLESSMQVYPGNPKFCSEPLCTIEKEGCSVSHLHMGSHTGTHIDAPFHFMADGKKIDEVDPSTFIGRTVLVDVDCQPRQEIKPVDFLWQLEDSDAVLHGTPKIIFFRTGWSKHWKTDHYLDHPCLSQESAKELIARGFTIIGLDTLSPDSIPRSGQEVDFVAHKTILGAGGFIIENLTNLEKIPQKYFISSILPLCIKDGDGSPVRAVAWQEGNVFAK